MANVTIPNLPQVTATTDLDILVITDSGETTTSKITKADFLSGVGGGAFEEDANGNVYIPSTVTLTGSHNFFVPTSDENETWHVDGPNNTMMILSTLSTMGRDDVSYSSIINSSNSKFDFYNQGAYNSIIASADSQMLNSSYRAAIIASRDCDITDTQQGVTIGSRNSNQSGGISSSLISTNSSTMGSGDYSSILGGSQNSIGAQNYSAIIGGQLNVINSGGYNAIIGGYDNENNHARTFIGGGQRHIAGTGGGDSAIVGGRSNTLSNNVEYAAIVGGLSNTIGSLGFRAAIIGGNNNQATGTGSVVIGSNALTISDNYTTGMDNTYTKSHASYGTYSGTSSGTGVQLFDADNGMVQFCEHTSANLNLEVQNCKNGEVYDYIVDVTGPVSINTVTAPAGFTAVDNTSGSAPTGVNHFRIAVVNDLVVFSQL